MPTGVYIRRKFKRRKRRPKGYVAPPSPARRATPWVSVCLRAEHYAMLRELGEFYEASLSSIASTLITEQFLKVLEQNWPKQAQQMREELKNEKYTKKHINLNPDD
jgi:hypothetical protein